MQLLTKDFVHLTSLDFFQADFQNLKQEVEAFVATLDINQVQDIRFDSGTLTNDLAQDRVFHRGLVFYLA